MSPPVDPTEVPFTALRLPTTPLAPRPAFAAELRRQLQAALSRTDPPASAPPEAPMSTTTPTTTPTLIPYLAVAGGAAAIDWYTAVLGAVEVSRFVGDDGRVGHAELVIGPAHIYLADEYPEIGVVGPATLGGTSFALHLHVVDVDYSYERAVAAGATGQRPPDDQGHGSRNATILDPFGHRWMLSQPIDAARADTADAADTSGADLGGGGWTVTGRRPVEPGYLVLQTGDLAQAQAFFGQLFGWEFEVGGAGGGHVANTSFPLGLMPSGDDATTATRLASTATTIYFRVDEIGPYADRVRELGGHVLAETDYPSGGNAECTDDQGYRFDLWKPAPGY